MKKVVRIGLLFVASLWIAGVLFSLGAISQAQESATAKHFLEEEPVVTHHKVTVHGKTLSYTARAGYLSLRDEEQIVHARMFYVAYSLDDASASTQPRPLLFAWNGGPGSNAALLELGALGPRRIEKRPESATADQPSALVDNDDTWLEFADLVFVDPIDTGYSYATSPDTLKEFLNDQGDADSVAEFIRLYRRHYALQQAPLYIMGESYGTYRAAGVAEILAQRKIPLNGVILLSSVLNFALSEASDLSSVFLLPNYAATAFVHHRLAPELESNLEQTVNEAQRWAESDYLAALIQGDRLPADRKKAIAQKLARYTGIPGDTWEKADLRIEPDQFALDVLGNDKLEYVGHYDTTVIGKLSHNGEPYNVEADPSLANGVDAIIYGYLRNDLGFTTDAFYKGPFGGGWPSATSFRADWTSVRWSRGTQFRDRGVSLAAALHSTPALRVLVTAGYFDFSTPFAATEYSVSHLGLDPDTRKRIKFIRYEGGHAAYIAPKVRTQFAEDVKSFVLPPSTSK
jgi:carboxypeptidase C (cathepsin A)